jgi:hypothetical protein
MSPISARNLLELPNLQLFLDTEQDENAAPVIWRTGSTMDLRARKAVN